MDDEDAASSPGAVDHGDFTSMIETKGAEASSKSGKFWRAFGASPAAAPTYAPLSNLDESTRSCTTRGSSSCLPIDAGSCDASSFGRGCGSVGQARAAAAAAAAVGVTCTTGSSLRRRPTRKGKGKHARKKSDIPFAPKANGNDRRQGADDCSRSDVGGADGATGNGLMRALHAKPSMQTRDKPKRSWRRASDPPAGQFSPPPLLPHSLPPAPARATSQERKQRSRVRQRASSVPVGEDDSEGKDGATGGSRRWLGKRKIVKRRRDTRNGAVLSVDGVHGVSGVRGVGSDGDGDSRGKDMRDGREEEEEEEEEEELISVAKAPPWMEGLEANAEYEQIKPTLDVIKHTVLLAVLQQVCCTNLSCLMSPFFTESYEPRRYRHGSL